MSVQTISVFHLCMVLLVLRYFSLGGKHVKRTDKDLPASILFRSMAWIHSCGHLKSLVRPWTSDLRPHQPHTLLDRILNLLDKDRGTAASERRDMRILPDYYSVVEGFSFHFHFHSHFWLLSIIVFILR